MLVYITPCQMQCDKDTEALSFYEIRSLLIPVNYLRRGKFLHVGSKQKLMVRFSTKENNYLIVSHAVLNRETTLTESVKKLPKSGFLSVFFLTGECEWGR